MRCIACGILPTRRKADAISMGLYQCSLVLPPMIPIFSFTWDACGSTRDIPRARSALDRFIVARPGHVPGLVIRGRALGALGDRLAAAADYDRVIARLDPPEPEHYLQRARWLVAEGGVHVDAGLRGIDEAIARLGPLVILIEFAIDVETGRGRHAAALARFASLPEALAGCPDWLARRGDVLHAAGRVHEASTAYADALAAIEGLSAKRRTVKVTVALEARLRRLLAGN